MVGRLIDPSRDKNLVEVANVVRGRRDALGITSAGALGRRAGVSPRTVGEVERAGSKVTQATYDALERALDLEPGLLARIAGGDRPSIEIPPHPPDPSLRLRDLTTEAAVLLGRLDSIATEMRTLLAEADDRTVSGSDLGQSGP